VSSGWVSVPLTMTVRIRSETFAISAPMQTSRRMRAVHHRQRDVRRRHS
jgi:hypothetical protein